MLLKGVPVGKTQPPFTRTVLATSLAHFHSQLSITASHTKKIGTSLLINWVMAYYRIIQILREVNYINTLPRTASLVSNASTGVI